MSFADNFRRKKVNIGQKTALVTGASFGIGRELAKLLAEEGFNLVIIARSRNALAELANEILAKFELKIETLAMDLTMPKAADEIYLHLLKKGIAIDLLVNNAGFGQSGHFSEYPLDIDRDMIALNISALLELNKIFLAEMKEQNYGHILNVASFAGFFPGPEMAVYSATKSFVLNFTQALAEEMRGSNVRIQALCPGPTKTDFFKVAGMEDSLLASEAKLNSEQLADLALRGMKSRKVVLIPDSDNWFWMKISKLLPENWHIRKIQKMNAVPQEQTEIPDADDSTIEATSDGSDNETVNNDEEKDNDLG